jgi:flagellar basal-body rod protein FlgB
MDTERSAFAENAVQYQASISFINGLLTSMQRAVQGQ